MKINGIPLLAWICLLFVRSQTVYAGAGYWMTYKMFRGRMYILSEGFTKGYNFALTVPAKKQQTTGDEPV
jgi:hypothetical protein